VTLANKLVANNNNRLNKVLFSNIPDGTIDLAHCYNERDESHRIVTQIAGAVKRGQYRYSDFAILMRINALSRNFEEQLLNYNIPHIVWGGFKFYERAEVKRTSLIGPSAA
jgi:DNA helicase-2/ATP-dependent DNA helicase PcrA